MKRVAPLLLLLAGCDLLIPTPTVIGGGTARAREGEGEEGEGEEGEGEEGEGEEGEGEEGEGEPGDGPAILVQLTWTGTGSDLDVRGVAENANGDLCAPGAFFDGGSGTAIAGPLLDDTCTPNDAACSFQNCKATLSGRPDWDGDGSGDSDGDPVIDIDDVNGFGPENLSVSAASDGSYLFGALGFRTDGTDCATLTVFINGTSRLERTLPVEENSWSEIAVVDVSGGVATVTPLLANQTCP